MLGAKAGVVDIDGRNAVDVFEEDVGWGSQGEGIGVLSAAGDMQGCCAASVCGVGVAKGECGKDDLGVSAVGGVVEEAHAVVVDKGCVGKWQEGEEDGGGMVGWGVLCGIHERGHATVVLVVWVGVWEQDFDGFEAEFDGGGLKRGHG